jgi:hypothetical protein
VKSYILWVTMPSLYAGSQNSLEWTPNTKTWIFYDWKGYAELLSGDVLWEVRNFRLDMWYWLSTVQGFSLIVILSNVDYCNCKHQLSHQIENFTITQIPDLFHSSTYYGFYLS